MILKTNDDVGNLEKLIGQLQGLYTEISQLTKKSANDGLNVFKLRIVNGILANANLILLADYKPLENFSGFEEDALPTNSDVTMILALYMEQLERLRSGNVIYEDYSWQYLINGEASGIRSMPPNQVGGQKK